ncbi:MAG: SPOR domain-containing protein [Phycisphaerales bacterium]|jgi:hypothetical protein|nr:SPOR domain-containing protein [Phycisphaerales bacterium]
MRRPYCYLMSLVCATAMLTGCQPERSESNLQRVERLYGEGLNGAASAAASVVARGGSADAAAAAWYGGLAEFKQGHDEQARTFFKKAARSASPEIAGGAEAMLAQLATRRGDYAQSLRRAERAWSLLRGSDRRQAAIRGLAAAEVAGDTLAVGRWRGRLEGQSASTPHAYVLQAAAYRSRSSADAHAARLEASAGGAGLGPVTVRSRQDPNGDWWLVQCGGFASRAEASVARRRLPREELIVARVSR